jgi:hypothetical protein
VRLGEAVETLRGPGRGDHRGQRPGRLAGLPPVVREPGVGRRLTLQGLGVAAVQGGGLGRQHLGGEDLGDQPVPQPVTVGRAGHEAVRHRGPDCLDQPVGVERHHPGQHGVLDRLDAGRDRVHHGVRAGRQLVDPGQEDLAQRVGQLDPAVAQVTGQFLGHERVAAAALVDPVGVLRLDLLAGDRGHQLEGLLPVERGQVDDPHRAQPAQLGQDPAQRVRAVQRLGPHRGQHRELDVTEAGQQVEEQLPGAAVGPLQIVEDEQQAPVTGHRPQVAGDPLEQRAGIAGRLATVVGRTPASVELAQRLEHRVQRRGVTDVEAGSGQHGVTRVTHRPDGLAQQPALADAALPGDEHRGRASRTDVAQVGLDVGERAGASDKRPVLLLAGHAGQPSANPSSRFSSVRTFLRHMNDGRLALS